MTKALKALDKHYWSDKELQMYEQAEKKVWDYRAAEYQRGIDEGQVIGKREGIKLGEVRGKREGKREGLCRDAKKRLNYTKAIRGAS